MDKLDIALLGLGVMGQNLAMNIARNGWKIGVWNRTSKDSLKNKVEEFMQTKARNTDIKGFTQLPELILSLKKPRIVLFMVQAGEAVDQLLKVIIPLLDEGDIVIDGGNSFFEDTERRVKMMYDNNMYFVGCGISGGEEGALYGASIMPGGAKQAWPVIKPILKSIAAKADDGTPCCDWVGPGGAGHYVKMVHNGIEYGDMQIIAEVYYSIKHLLDYDNEQISDVFNSWRGGRLQSYLIDITADILKHKDYNGDYVLDQILDTSGQKGTGRWSVMNALELNMPLDIIASAVFARNLAAHKEMRSMMSHHYSVSSLHPVYNSNELIPMLEQTLYCSRLVGYAQGFTLMKKASDEYKWNLDLSTIALLWRAGCIIRSAFLNEIAQVYENTPLMGNLLLDDHFGSAIRKGLVAWEKSIGIMLREGLPAPVLSASLNYFLGLINNNSNANMIQAMRDYFGAHTFERVDSPRGEFFHENWIDKDKDE